MALKNIDISFQYSFLLIFLFSLKSAILIIQLFQSYFKKKFDGLHSKVARQQCLIRIKVELKKEKKAQKEKQFLSNYAKYSFICNWIKPGNSSLLDPC